MHAAVGLNLQVEKPKSKASRKQADALLPWCDADLAPPVIRVVWFDLCGSGGAVWVVLGDTHAEHQLVNVRVPVNVDSC